MRDRWFDSFPGIGMFVHLAGLPLLASGVLFAGCGSDGSMADPLHFTVASSGDAPLDSTPDSNAGFVYFIGSDQHGPGVFRAPASGGAITTIPVASSLAKPVSLSLSGDDQTVYVADTTLMGGGQVLSIQISSGMVLSTFANNYHPAGVEVASQGGKDIIYFTGTDLDGKPALFSFSESAPMPAVIAKGDPFKAPGAVAVAANGDLYVTDTPGVKGQGRIIKVTGGAATDYLTQLSLGNPAGLALTLDDKTLVVSAIDATTGNDEVLIVDVAAKSVTHFNKGIEGNKNGGGGHRARKQNIFSWADLTAGKAGVTFVIKK